MQGAPAVSLPKTSRAVFQIAGTSFMAVPTGFAINGQSVAEGGSAVTVDGTVISLGPSGLQIGSSTIPINAEQTAEAPQSIFEIDGKTFTAAPTGFPLAGQTVADGGPAVTIDGTTVSLGSLGLQIGSSMLALTAGQTAGPSMGGLIMSGFGSVPSATAGASNSPSGVRNNSSDMPFTGGSNMKSTLDVRMIIAWFMGLSIGITAYVL